MTQLTPQLVATSIGDWFAQTTLDGSLLLAIPIAVIAGVVSFFSPCVVPLLPGYVSYVTGLSGADMAAARETSVFRGRMTAGMGLFVLGFTTVFMITGAFAGALGQALIAHQDIITRVLGVLTIVLGIAFLGAIPFLQREWRVHKVPSVGLAAAPLLGGLFALGWVPCLGPTLGAVLTLAYDEASAGRGALLAFVYALGLGIPFIIAGLMFRRMLGAVAWIRQHQMWITRAGGVMLIAVGVLLVTGAWDLLVADLRSWVGQYGTVV